jgi:hypothetical protein
MSTVYQTKLQIAITALTALMNETEPTRACEIGDMIAQLENLRPVAPPTHK